MEYITLGKTGLNVSVAGLGCGGHSRLGQAMGKSESESVALVRGALDLGINFLDTAEAYGTEAIVGKAIQKINRDWVVISTKATLPPIEHPNPDREIRNSLEKSLCRLRIETVDIYHLHSVLPEQYRIASEEWAPILLRMREEGKIRYIGITEFFAHDPDHRMLAEALEEDYWDVVMTGFNMLNPSARTRVLARASENGVGTLVMFAVRKALSQPNRLKEVVQELKRKGLIKPETCDSDSPLGFLTQYSKAVTLPEAAYRFCRHEPGVNVVLMGTGNPRHLRENVKSFLKPPLPELDLQRLEEIFGRVNTITGG